MTRLAATITVALATGLPAGAQNAEDGMAGPRDTRDATYMQRPDGILVEAASGTPIGTVGSVLIDQDGRPAGFLLEMGGFLGMMKTQVGVPLDALVWNGAHYVSRLSPEQLETLAPFDE